MKAALYARYSSDNQRDASIEDQLQFEATEQAKNFESADAQEGIAAVREKRAPRFHGR